MTPAEWTAEALRRSLAVSGFSDEARLASVLPGLIADVQAEARQGGAVDRSGLAQIAYEFVSGKVHQAEALIASLGESGAKPEPWQVPVRGDDPLAPGGEARRSWPETAAWAREQARAAIERMRETEAG